MSTAYLIVVCDKDTNAILEVCIWSSPEWHQSRFLEHPTYVAFQLSANTYQEAGQHLLKMVADPLIGKRYHHLYKYMKPETIESYSESKAETYPQRDDVFYP